MEEGFNWLGPLGTTHHLLRSDPSDFFLAPLSRLILGRPGCRWFLCPSNHISTHSVNLNAPIQSTLPFMALLPLYRMDPNATFPRPSRIIYA